jgi:hypothetical protein
MLEWDLQKSTAKATMLFEMSSMALCPLSFVSCPLLRICSWPLVRCRGHWIGATNDGHRVGAKNKESMRRARDHGQRT